MALRARLRGGYPVVVEGVSPIAVTRVNGRDRITLTSSAIPDVLRRDADEVPWIASSLSNGKLEHWTNGTSFITSGGVGFSDNFTADKFTHGPGTGGTCAGESSRITLAAADRATIGARYAARIQWTAPPTASEGRPTYPAYFSNCYWIEDGAHRHMGRSVRLTAWVRASQTMTIYPFYSDGYGASDAERFQWGASVTLVANTWTQVTRTYVVPVADLTASGTGTHDRFSIGFGVLTTEFSGKTYPLNFDCTHGQLHVLTPIKADGVPDYIDSLNRCISSHRKVGYGIMGMAIGPGSIQIGTTFETPMIAVPGISLSGEMTIWQLGETYTSSGGAITEAAEVTERGFNIKLSGWTGLVPGAAVLVTGTPLKIFAY